jgi:hypothetical protein
VKKPLAALLAAAAMSSPAAAQELEVFASAGTFPFNAGAALRQLPLGTDYDLAAEIGFSLRAVWAGLGGAFDLGPAGRIAADTRLSYVYGDGARVGLNLRGTVGPVALDARGAYWTASAAAEDPLAPLVLRPDPAGESGFLAAADLSYRLGRNDLLRPSVRFSSLSTVLALRYENRSPSLTWSLGGLTAFQSSGNTFAVVAGLRVVPEDAPFAVSIDGLAGVGPFGFAYGVSADLTADLNEEGGVLRLYGAYEPWRDDAITGRAGAELSLPAGPGEIAVDGRVGFTPAVAVGGVRVAYRLPF